MRPENVSTSSPVPAPALSVITPTFNEAGNIDRLLDALGEALATVEHEIIVVDDDSPDRTWELAEKRAAADPRIRVLRRFHDHGLSPAVSDGMEVARGEVLAVIDADLQHDETLLPEMVRILAADEADLVVGSRNTADGSYGEWSRRRRFVSWVATMIARLFLRLPLSDPMSGFFAIRRDAFEESAPQLNPQGFKILLEILGRSPDLRVRELGFRFRNREAGETKLNRSVVRSYLLAVFDLRFGHQIKPQFLLYTLVGLIGVAVNYGGLVIADLLGLGTITTGLGAAVDPLQIPVLVGLGLFTAFTFAANNWFTFWELRYRGSRLPLGFALFGAVTLYGTMIQFAVAKWLGSLGLGVGWLGEGGARLLYHLIAILVAFQSSYFLNVNLTWRRRLGPAGD